MTLGERIRQLRKQHGLSQARLSIASGMVLRQTIYKIEMERNPYPTLKTLTYLAAAFNITVSELLEPVAIDIEDPY